MSDLVQREHEEIWGRLGVGWCAGCWYQTKARFCFLPQAAISLKRVKIEEKLLWRAYRKSPTLFRTVASPTPYGLPFPKIGVHNPTAKLLSLLSQERLKLRTANLADTFKGSIRTQAHKKFWRKGSVGVSRNAQFFEYPLLSQERVKLRTSNFIQISGKVAGCVVRTLKNFQGTHILGASRGIVCDSSAVLFS